MSTDNQKSRQHRFEQTIAFIDELKKEAVNKQDFDRAYYLRDACDTIKKIRKEWREHLSAPFKAGQRVVVTSCTNDTLRGQEVEIACIYWCSSFQAWETYINTADGRRIPLLASCLSLLPSPAEPSEPAAESPSVAGDLLKSMEGFAAAVESGEPLMTTSFETAPDGSLLATREMKPVSQTLSSVSAAPGQQPKETAGEWVEREMGCPPGTWGDPCAATQGGESPSELDEFTIQDCKGLEKVFCGTGPAAQGDSVRLLKIARGLESIVSSLKARLAEIEAGANADAADLVKMRDGTKLTRSGLVQIIVYQQQDIRSLEARVAELEGQVETTRAANDELGKQLARAEEASQSQRRVHEAECKMVKGVWRDHEEQFASERSAREAAEARVAYVVEVLGIGSDGAGGYSSEGADMSFEDAVCDAIQIAKRKACAAAEKRVKELENPTIFFDGVPYQAYMEMCKLRERVKELEGAAQSLTSLADALDAYNRDGSGFTADDLRAAATKCGYPGHRGLGGLDEWIRDKRRAEAKPSSPSPPAGAANELDLSQFEGHTPGPWKRADKRGWSGFENPSGEDLLMYATCKMEFAPDEHHDPEDIPDWHSRIVFDNPKDEALALAAPQLLARVQSLSAECDRLRGENERLFDENAMLHATVNGLRLPVSEWSGEFVQSELNLARSQVSKLESKTFHLESELSAARGRAESLEKAGWAVMRGTYTDDDVLNRFAHVNVNTEGLRQLAEVLRPASPAQAAPAVEPAVEPVPAASPSASGESRMDQQLVEWGATQPKTDDELVADFRAVLAETRKHFNLGNGPLKMHGVYAKGTEIILCQTGVSPNSGTHAEAVARLWNHAVNRTSPAAPVPDGEWDKRVEACVFEAAEEILRQSRKRNEHDEDVCKWIGTKAIREAMKESIRRHLSAVQGSVEGLDEFFESGDTIERRGDGKWWAQVGVDDWESITWDGPHESHMAAYSAWYKARSKGETR